MTLMQQQWKRLNAAAALREIATEKDVTPKQRTSLLQIANWNVWESARLRRELGARLDMGGRS
jgi:hypothetical protein